MPRPFAVQRLGRGQPPVIRRNGGAHVMKFTKTWRMFSDNNAYSAYDRSIDKVCIIRRLVWFARTI